MNKFLETMSTDMGIGRYLGESDDSFIFRLCYSALGQWCLRIAQNSSGRSKGSTKHNQTAVLNELLRCYSEIFPNVADRFIDANNQQVNLSVHIRRVYEETGYLLTDDNKYNQLANYGRSIPMGNSSLFFGIPNEDFTVNGLGVFSKASLYKVRIREFLIRDTLTSEEYFQTQFDGIDFFKRDINVDELEFFNPLSNKVPSLSWEKKQMTEYSIARRSEMGPYYRVISEFNNAPLFAEESIEHQKDRLISYEYRRLHYALKEHYHNPLKARIIPIDKEYSEIKIGGYLPNREYYFMKLVSWPVNHAFDKGNFLLKNCFIREIVPVFKNLGIFVEGGSLNV